MVQNLIETAEAAAQLRMKDRSTADTGDVIRAAKDNPAKFETLLTMLSGKPAALVSGFTDLTAKLGDAQRSTELVQQTAQTRFTEIDEQLRGIIERLSEVPVITDETFDAAGPPNSDASEAAVVIDQRLQHIESLLTELHERKPVVPVIPPLPNRESEPSRGASTLVVSGIAVFAAICGGLIATLGRSWLN